ncbi:hypothetical protein [Ureibacillus manganicus]|uniref:Uncharacterized protein n=1 Tax=Ureibacillus manganicus DSM 26584 TaxID=1384049 RepID=A0A0A3I3M8_9BACL|nr:hypothetical protein [Ureibacillus manganicus]KGR79304.1 hypothetical protein CD29_06290 [Ureibacillus manganicus DSM 26584]
MKILQFVIPKKNYSLCLVNPEKKDIFNLYIRYLSLEKKHPLCNNNEPIMMMTEQLYGESYAILEEEYEPGIHRTCEFEVLYVSDDGVILQKFSSNEIQKEQTLHTHSLFTCPILEIEETDYEIIDPEEIIQIVFKDIYVKGAPTNSISYRRLLNKSELFEPFFKDLYIEMGRFHNGDKCLSTEKWEFAKMLQSNYHVQLVQSEGSDIILSNCTGIIKKLKISQEQMAEYFIKFLD